MKRREREKNETHNNDKKFKWKEGREKIVAIKMLKLIDNHLQSNWFSFVCLANALFFLCARLRQSGLGKNTCRSTTVHNTHGFGLGRPPHSICDWVYVCASLLIFIQSEIARYRISSKDKRFFHTFHFILFFLSLSCDFVVRLRQKKTFWLFEYKKSSFDFFSLFFVVCS